MNYAKGSDISFWQDDPTTPRVVDFDMMARTLDFVFIRAGQNLWKDKVFDTHWENAKVSGIPRGSYWFYDSRANPIDQARKYIEVLNGDLGELPLVADFEDGYGGRYGTLLHLYDFIEELKKLAPQKEVMIYTGYYYWQEKVNELPLPERGRVFYFSQYSLWLAWYRIDMSDLIVPSPWKNWTLWQYTSNGNGIEHGVESDDIDLNYFNGTKDEFAKRFKLDVKLPTGSSRLIMKLEISP